MITRLRDDVCRAGFAEAKIEGVARSLSTLGLRMTTLFASLWISAPLLAQESTSRGYTISVGLVLLCVLLGLAVALTPVKRDAEFRHVKEQ